MKKDAPKEFLQEYEKRKDNLESALQDIKDLLVLRLGQIRSMQGTRARLTDARLKRPAKIWKKAVKKGYTTGEAFEKIVDIVGLRIVCNNLSDAEAIVEMLRQQQGYLKINEVKETVSKPAPDGYKGIHVRATLSPRSIGSEETTPCEIQIRTLAQDTWARLSRADLYGKNTPITIAGFTMALSKQLAAIDDMAQIIRNELDRPAKKAQDVKDSDPVTPQRLALLFQQQYGEELYEWSLHHWFLNLQEAEAENIKEVKELLSDDRLRDALNRVAISIREHGLDDTEWAVYSALVASEVTRKAGIKAVKDRIQEEWDEITAQARSSTLPASIEDFIQELRDGSISEDSFSLLDCMASCGRCGNPILIEGCDVVSAILDYYETEDKEDELYELIERWRFDEGYSDDGMFCSYCQYQMSKDD